MSNKSNNEENTTLQSIPADMEEILNKFQDETAKKNLQTKPRYNLKITTDSDLTEVPEDFKSNSENIHRAEEQVKFQIQSDSYNDF